MIRWPRLWAKLFGAAIPSGALARKSAMLHQPESIGVSSSGQQLVVCNTLARSITRYSFADSSPDCLDLRLDDAFAHPELLEYAHGAIFHESDEAVLALGEYAHAISAIDVGAGRMHNDPSRILWVASGNGMGLENPADLALHPNGNQLVVANRRQTGLSVLHLDSSDRRSSPRFVNAISVSTLNSLGVAAPHGVAFAADGEYLFVSHKRFVPNRDDCGSSAVTVFAANADSMLDPGWAPIAAMDYGDKHLHHIACHPHRDILAVTNSRGVAEILGWSRVTRSLARLASIDLFRAGEGAKGVAFVKNGKYIALTTELDEILFFELADYVRGGAPGETVSRGSSPADDLRSQTGKQVHS